MNDPRAARSVWQVFGREGEASQKRAVQMLVPLDCLASSRALALLATWGGSPEVRRVAAEALRNRDPREYVGFLLALQRKEFRLVAGVAPIDGEHFRRTLTIEGDDLLISPDLEYSDLGPDHGIDMIVTAEFQRVIWNPRRFFTADVPFDGPLGEWYSYAAAWPGSLGGPMASPAAAQMVQQMVAQPQNAAAIVSNHQTSAPSGHPVHGSAAAGLTPDQRTSLFVQNWMAAARFRDAQVLWAQTSPMNESPNFVDARRLLRRGQSHDSRDELGDLRKPEPDHQPGPARGSRSLAEVVLRCARLCVYTHKEKPEKPKIAVFISLPSCFAAGTQVRTLLGLRPIEKIEVGDQVLAQDPITGKLSFETVDAVHHNPPGKTLKIRLGSEEILPSIYHRFWCAGRGWVMARDLKPGDEVRTLGGRVRVDSVSPARSRRSTTSMLPAAIASSSAPRRPWSTTTRSPPFGPSGSMSRPISTRTVAAHR